MSFDLSKADRVLNRLYQGFIDDLVGTFDPDPYPRRAKYEQVPLSKKKLRALDAAEELLNRYDAHIEEGPRRTRTKRTWLETVEEWQARLATLPEKRSDWIKQQLAEGKKPPKSALWYDLDYREAIGVGEPVLGPGYTVTIPVIQRPTPPVD